MAFVNLQKYSEVELVQKTKNAETLALQASGLCRGNDLSIEKLVKICEQGHLSVLEHNSFTFKITCSTIARTHFLRHRLCSFTERSLRSTEPEGIQIPKSENEEAIKIMLEISDLAFTAYDKLVECGIPRETARYILPQGTLTTFFLTANARELLHIVKLRTSSHALEETRDIANGIWNIMGVEMPHIFTNDAIIQMA